MSKYGQQFLESNAILAAQEEDEVELDKILSQMTDGEMARLASGCDVLIRALRRWRGAGVDLGS